MTPKLAIASEIPNIAQNLNASELLAILQEAENGDTRNLFALYRDVLCDSHVQAEITKRKAAILSDKASIQPFDKTNAQDIAAAETIEPLLETSIFSDAVSSLLDATVFPVSVIEKIYTPSGKGYILSALVPVPMQLLDFSNPDLRIFDVSADGRILTTSHAPDPARYIVHRQSMLPIPDRWGGAMRAVLYWWLLRTMSRQWWASLLERFGTPFIVGKYQSQTPEDKSVLESAFRMAVRLGGVVVTKGTEVELVQASQNDSGAAHGSFIALCNAEISKLIVGQTLSTTPASTGLGSGVAELQGQVRDDIRKMDAMRVANTLRTQLFRQMLDINNIHAQAPVLSLGIDSAADTFATVSLISSLASAGLELEDEGIATLAEKTGLKIRRKIQEMPSPLGFSATQAGGPSVPASGSNALESADFEIIQAIFDGSTSEEQAQRRIEAWLKRNSPELIPELKALMKRASDASAQ